MEPRTSEGVLILPRGFPINESSREHVMNFLGRIAGAVKVLAPADSVPAWAQGGA